MADQDIEDIEDDFIETVRKHMADKFESCPTENELAIKTFGFLLGYLYRTQLCDLRHLNKITVSSRKEYVEIDPSTWRNLEITENMRTKEKKGSLLGVLDKTLTAMGARCMRKNLEKPLANAAEIVKRQNAVKVFFEAFSIF